MSEPRSRLSRFEDLCARNALFVSCALFVVALAPRVWIATSWTHEAVWDGHYYHFGAQRIAEGHGYSDERVTPTGVEWHPWCHYPVGYSAFLALFYRVFGASVSVGTLAGALVGAATALVVHRLALRHTSNVRALVAGLVCALHPGLVMYAGLLMTEPLAALGLVLAPLAYHRGAEMGGKTRPLVGAVFAGLVLGLTTLVRPQSLLSAPLVGLFAKRADGTDRGGWKRALSVALVTTIGCVAVVVPWTVRNCRVMDGCAFVSTNGGWNLAIGSSPHATGRFDAINGSDGCREVTGQVQQDRCWFDQGVKWIERDPGRWLSLVPKKLAYTFDHQSFAVGYLSQADPDAWPEERRARYRKGLSAVQYLLLGAAALGTLRRPRARRLDLFAWSALLTFVGLFATGVLAEPPTVWLVAVGLSIVGSLAAFRRDESGIVPYVAATVGGLCVVHAVFFGEDRYQIVVTPALALLSAFALGSARQPAVEAEAATARATDASLEQP